MQLNTWASHVNVRHFWGVTECQDYDENCDSMSEEALQSFVQTCKGPMGWDKTVKQYGAKEFGVTSGSGLEGHHAYTGCSSYDGNDA